MAGKLALKPLKRKPRKPKAVKNPVKKAPIRVPVIKNKNKLKQIININVGGKTHTRTQTRRSAVKANTTAIPLPAQHTFMSSVPMDFQQKSQNNILKLLNANNQNNEDVETQDEYKQKMQDEQDKLSQAMNEGKAEDPTPTPSIEAHIHKKQLMQKVRDAAIQRAQQHEMHQMHQEDVRGKLLAQQAETLKAINKSGSGAGGEVKKKTRIRKQAEPVTYDEAVNNLKAMSNEQINSFLVGDRLTKYAKAFNMTSRYSENGIRSSAGANNLRASIIANLRGSPTTAPINEYQSTEYITVHSGNRRKR